MSNLSLRTLFIVGSMPFPPLGGGALRNWQNINVMQSFGDVAVFSLCKNTDTIPADKSLPGVAVWKYHQYKNPHQLSLREKLQVNISGFLPGRHERVDSLYSHTAAQKLDAFLTEFQPDVVVIAEIWLYRYLPIVKRHKCRIILDNHNVEANLYRDIYCSGAGFGPKIRSFLKLPQVTHIERDFIRQVDQVWVCSDKDVTTLLEWHGQMSHVKVIPNAVNVAANDCVRLGECSLPDGWEKVPETLIYVASFIYPPNVEAAELLINRIFPRLRKVHPNCRLLLVGANPSASMLAAGEQDGITVTGRVADVRSYLAAASVVVVPLLQGSGTRLKILEAFAAGLPVVSTAKGAEGLNVTDGEQLLIRNSLEEIVAGISMLWADAAGRQKLVQAGYELVQAEYSWAAVTQRVETVLNNEQLTMTN